MSKVKLIESKPPPKVTELLSGGADIQLSLKPTLVPLSQATSMLGNAVGYLLQIHDDN